jgi:8-oxo-dGTP pyrophosphatase MutT (NUDIX family)
MSHHHLALLATARDRQVHPNSVPQDAATLIAIDRTTRVPSVLLGRRRDDLAFMPGRLVFPGGRVEPEDRVAPVAAPLTPVAESKLQAAVHRPSARKAHGYALAAVRETFEETGLLVGGGAPDLRALQFVARAVTPPRLVRRFDTRFFTADASVLEQRAEVVGPHAELVELVWMPIDSALEIKLAEITRVVLAELRDRIEAGLDPTLPVPYYRMLHGRFTRTEL